MVFCLHVYLCTIYVPAVVRGALDPLELEVELPCGCWVLWKCTVPLKFESSLQFHRPVQFTMTPFLPAEWDTSTQRSTHPQQAEAVPQAMSTGPPSAADHSEAKAPKASQNSYSSWASGYLVGEPKVRHSPASLCLVEIVGVYALF